jgi:hypothetical protein
MPFYRFIIQGEGKLRDGVTGFFTTRWCRASDLDRAAQKALQMVAEDCRKEGLQTSGQGPHLEIVEGRAIGFFDVWKGSNKGSVFYRDPETEAAAKEIEFEASGWIFGPKSL